MQSPKARILKARILLATAIAALTAIVALSVCFWGDSPSGSTVASTAPGNPPRPIVTNDAEVPSPNTVSHRRVEVADAKRVPVDHIRVIVIDARGSRVGGATVRLVRTRLLSYDVIDRSMNDRLVVSGENTTDANGVCSVPGIRGIKYQVHARASGFVEGWVEDAFVGDEVTVALGQGGTIYGSAQRAESGTGVGGVVVRGWRSFHEGRPVWSAESAFHGGFRIDAIPAGTYSVEMVSPSEELQIRAGVEVKEGRATRCDFSLGSPVKTVGTVTVKDEGTPIVGATVSADAWGHKHVATNGRGEYELVGFPARSQDYLWVNADGFARACVRQDKGAELIVRCDIALARGAVCYGRVVDEVADPVENAYVASVSRELRVSTRPSHGRRVADVELPEWVGTTSNEEGRFVIDSLHPAKAYWLFVHKPGYGTKIVNVIGSLSVKTPRDLGDVVLALPGRIDGRVVSDDGSPCANARVSVRPADADWTVRENFIKRPDLGSAEVETDRRGRFCVPDLAAGNYIVHAAIDGIQLPLERLVELRSGGSTEVELVAPRLARIDGRVIGFPVGGECTVQIRAVGNGVSRTLHVAPEGVYSTTVWPGEYTVRALDDAGRGSKWEQHTFQEGDNAVNIVMPGMSHVAGTVVAANREPVAGAIVSVVGGLPDEPQLIASTLTDGQGRFTVIVPTSAIFSISARRQRDPAGDPLIPSSLSSPGQAGWLRDVKPGTTGLVVVLP